MILHRFMSKREYDALMAGKQLVNTIDHGAQGERSSSIGFCFSLKNQARQSTGCRS